MLPTTAEPWCKPNADSDRRQPALHPLLAQARDLLLHAHGGHQRISGTAFGGDGCAEQSHHAIADEFVERPMRLENRRRHHAEKVIQQIHYFARVHLLGQGREAADVGEQDRHGCNTPPSSTRYRPSNEIRSTTCGGR